jgi:hypothetical protein
MLPDLVVDLRVKVNTTSERKRQRKDRAPFEPEPTEVDQTTGDNNLP